MSKAAFAASTGLAIVLAAPSWAQTANPPPTDQLDEIVVTAQRREQSLLSVPLAVSAISGDMLAEQGVADVTQLVSSIPNLQAGSAFGKSQPNFSLRGISVGNDYSANQASPVGVYFDDAYIASRNVHGSQLYDIERAEVLRGPQGTLFGRNTTGGAINIISKLPALAEGNGYLALGKGNNNTSTLQGAVERTLEQDVAGIRIAFDASDNDGKLRNRYPGRDDPAAGSSYGGRVGLLWRPVETVDVYLKAYGSKEDLTQAPIHGVGSGPGGVNPYSGYSRQSLPFYEVDSNNLGYRRGNSWGLLAKINYEVDENLLLSSLTSHDGNKLDVKNDADGSPVEVLTVDFGSKARQVNQEFKFQWTRDDITLVGGAYYGWDRTNSRNYYQIFYLFDALGIPPDPMLSGAGGAGIVQQFDQIGQSKALFSQADWTFAPGWTLTAGLRYTWDSAKLLNARSYLSDYDANPIVYTVAGPGGSVLPSRKGKSQAPTWRLALNHEFEGGNIVYASYSRGYRGGTFNGNGYIDPSQLTYTRPEKVKSYEIGAKGKAFDNRFTYSLTGFYADYTDQQVVDIIGIAAFLRNAGASTLKGAELETKMRVSDGLDIRVSGSYLDAKYKSLSLQGTDLSGRSLPYAPKWTAQLGFDLDLIDNASGTLTFSPGLNYISRQYFSSFNALAGNGNLQQGGYTLASATLQWAGDGYSILLYGRNISDRKYYVWGNNTRGFGFDFLSPGEPVSYGATLRFEF